MENYVIPGAVSLVVSLVVSQVTARLNHRLTLERSAQDLKRAFASQLIDQLIALVKDITQVLFRCLTDAKPDSDAERFVLHDIKRMNWLIENLDDCHPSINKHALLDACVDWKRAATEMLPRGKRKAFAKKSPEVEALLSASAAFTQKLDETKRKLAG